MERGKRRGSDHRPERHRDVAERTLRNHPPSRRRLARKPATPLGHMHQWANRLIPRTIASTDAKESWKPMSAVEPGSATHITMAANARLATASLARSSTIAIMYVRTITIARTVDT